MKRQKWVLASVSAFILYGIATLEIGQRRDLNAALAKYLAASHFGEYSILQEDHDWTIPFGDPIVLWQLEFSDLGRARTALENDMQRLDEADARHFIASVSSAFDRDITGWTPDVFGDDIQIGSHLCGCEITVMTDGPRAYVLIWGN